MEEEKTVFIYALLDPDILDVRYVGKSNNPKKRLGRHIYNAKTRYDEPDALHVERWVKKLLDKGKRPVLKILEEVPLSEWEEAEMRHIAQYEYLTNIAKGGNGPYSVSDETRKKISLANKGRKFSEETLRKRSIALRGIPRTEKQLKALREKCAHFGSDNPRYGKPCPPQVKEAASKANSKPILQYTLNGEFVREWPSISSAAKEVDGKSPQFIKVLKGKWKYYKGFVWRYKDQPLDLDTFVPIVLRK